MREVERLLLELDSDEIMQFAENHCCWYDTDYYNEYHQDEDDEWSLPLDGYSLVNSALDAIREWATTDETLTILREYVGTIPL